MTIHTNHLTLTKITPDDARSLVESPHSKQRKTSKSHVNVIAGRITSGLWDPFASIFVLDDRGRVVDGMHRLHAIIQSGKSVDAFVVTLPWSRWRDDTRRRSVDDRNCVSRHMASTTRLAGRLINMQDPDKALDYFRDVYENSALHEVPHTKPWSCAAVFVGALAAHMDGFDGAGLVKRLIKASPSNDWERKLLRRASAGRIITTGAAEHQLAADIFSAASKMKRTVDELRVVLA